MKKINCYTSFYNLGAKLLRISLLSFIAMLTTSSYAISDEERPLFGVQRWDMYSGKGATHRQELGYLPGRQAFLKPQEWHHRAPFFARRTKDVDWVEHPAEAGPLWFNYPFDENLLQKSMDDEIDFASDAGIDFFIFNGPARTLIKNGYELSNNLDAYLKNTRKDKTKFVIALFGFPHLDYGRTRVNLMLDETIAFMKLPSWQTVKDGRPLLPILRPLMFEEQMLGQSDPGEIMTLAEFVLLIRARATAAGLKDPYIVGQEIVRTYMHKDKFTQDGFDAFADYSGSYGGTYALRDQAPTYAKATDEMIKVWQQQSLSTDIDFIPAMAIGSYQWPRAKAKIWYHYLLPELGDITKRIEQTFEFIKRNKAQGSAEIIFSYSWNEHSEGGAINPTMGASPDYIPNTRWLDEVSLGLNPRNEKHNKGKQNNEK